MSHPCLHCGACCAAFRVAFHWSEATAGHGAVPPDAVVRWDAHRVALLGTDRRQPHCAQLEGEVGATVSCRIYAQRPSPCRELRAAWEDGQPSEQCDRARARYGLPALTPATWQG
jgi:Fe-S-cluster containining protein